LQHILDKDNGDRKAAAPLRCLDPKSTKVSAKGFEMGGSNLAEATFFDIFQLLFLQLQSEKLDSPEL
jgi:hypothetical protein